MGKTLRRPVCRNFARRPQAQPQQHQAEQLSEGWEHYIQPSTPGLPGTVEWAESYTFPPEKATMTIPKVIHQIWIGPRPAPERWMRTWREKNPTWQYVMWDNKKCSETHFDCQDQIDAMPEWNGKADIIRYELLRRVGGLCFDADSECLLPLDEHFLGHNAFACYENERYLPGLIASGYLASEPGGTLMTEIVSRIARGVPPGPAFSTLGPIFLTRTVHDLGGADSASLYVYPARVFIPRHHYNSYSALAPGTAQSYANQFWGSTLPSGYTEGYTEPRKT